MGDDVHEWFLRREVSGTFELKDEAHPDTALAGVLTDYILGVRPTSPGYATYVVDPIPVPGITWAKGRVPTPRGMLEVEWRLENGKVEKKVVKK